MTPRSKSLVYSLIATLVAFLLILGLMAVADASEDESPAFIAITEVGWAGTMASPSDEYIELLNTCGCRVNLDGWYFMLTKEDGVTVTIQIPAIETDINDIVLLERTDDNTVSDRVADGIYAGGLTNSGLIRMELYSWDNVQQDVIEMPTGEWPAGDAQIRASMSLDYQTGEWYTSGPAGPDWAHDALGNPIMGTPGETNTPPLPPSCDIVPWYELAYDVHMELEEDKSWTYQVLIDVTTGDVSRVNLTLWWSYGEAAPRGWQVAPIEWPAGISSSCIDMVEMIADGSENILNRLPSNTGHVVLPNEMIVFLNVVHTMQASNPYGVALPVVVTEDK